MNRSKDTFTTQRREISECITLKCGALNSLEMTINKTAGCLINGIDVDEYYSDEGTYIANDNYQTSLTFENRQAKIKITDPSFDHSEQFNDDDKLVIYTTRLKSRLVLIL